MVEPWIVIPVVVGSNPILHPKRPRSIMAVHLHGKEVATVRFCSWAPSMYDDRSIDPVYICQNIPIPRRVYGEISKIVEEVLELQDANEQQAEVMVINELADIIGAIEGFWIDIIRQLRSRAFKSGHRSTKVTP